MSGIDIYSNQELPTIELSWYDDPSHAREFASGWTPTVLVVAETDPLTTILTKTAGITLADTAPNYVIEFTAADLTTIVAALGLGRRAKSILLYPYARRNGDSKDAAFRPGSPIEVTVHPAPV